MSIGEVAANEPWRVWVLFPVYPVGAELLIIVSIGRDNDTLAMLCQFKILTDQLAGLSCRLET